MYNGGRMAALAVVQQGQIPRTTLGFSPSSQWRIGQVRVSRLLGVGPVRTGGQDLEVVCCTVGHRRPALAGLVMSAPVCQSCLRGRGPERPDQSEAADGAPGSGLVRTYDEPCGHFFIRLIS